MSKTSDVLQQPVLKGGWALVCSQETEEALKVMAEKIRQEEQKQHKITDDDEDEDEKIFGEQPQNAVIMTVKFPPSPIPTCQRGK